MEEKIEEGEINGAIEPATMRQIETILNQMKKSVCKILEPKYATGFFCNIEINNKNTPVLITNYHVIDDAFIESGKKIKVQLGNDKNPKIINLNKHKRIYSNKNKEYDIMIIKLDKTDEIDDIQFLEIDDSLLKHNSELAYEDKSIYILHYPFGSEIRVSYGRGFTKKENNNFDMIHKCKTNFGSSGSPIFDLSTNKLIGIHKSYLKKINKNECVNLGTFLKYPLSEIKKYFQKLPKKISNNNAPLNHCYRRVKTPQLKEKKNIQYGIEKANFAQDIISFNELKLNKLTDHKDINKPKDLKINNDNIRNDKIIKQYNNIPNSDSNAIDLNQNKKGRINDLRKGDTNKLNIKNNSNFNKRQRNFFTHQENPIENSERIIKQDINNNMNLKKNIKNKNIINNKEKTRNKENQNMKEDKEQIKNIQNIKNNINKEQINFNQNIEVIDNNPGRCILAYLLGFEDLLENRINNNIQNMINKKNPINNNQNINKKNEEIENNQKNCIKKNQLNNNQKVLLPNKNNQNINTNKEEIKIQNKIIQYNNKNLSNSSNNNQKQIPPTIIYKKIQNIDINNYKININNNNKNVNNRYIQNNNKNIDNEINLNTNLRKKNESSLVIGKEPLVQELENNNIGFEPEKPTLYNNYTLKNLGRNKSNNNEINNFNNSIKEIHDLSQGPRDLIQKRIFKNNINNNNLKINASVEGPLKFFANNGFFEINNNRPTFTPNSNKSKNRIKKVSSISLKKFC